MRRKLTKMRGLDTVPNRMKTDTMRGVKTCNMRMYSMVRRIRAISLRNGLHMFSGSRYQCNCHSSVFGERLHKRCVVARIICQLVGSPTFGLNCNSLHTRIRTRKASALNTIHETIARVHGDGLPSPGVLNGTNDFFAGPVVPYRRCRTLGSRCPSVPSCPVSSSRMGIPTK